MPRLTAQQVTELANQFLDLAQTVGDYRMVHHGQLTSGQNKKLSDLHWDILNYADTLYVTSAKLVMEDVEDTLQAINDITQDIRRTYKQLQKIQKVLDVAAAVVTLGAAIMSKSPVAVQSAIAELQEVWNAEDSD